LCLTEVAVVRNLFAAILDRIERLRCPHRSSLSSLGAGATKVEEAKILYVWGKVPPRASKPDEGISRAMILTMGTQS